MCIIISNPTNNKIPKDNLKRAGIANPDGCGFAYVEGGRVWVGKSTNKKDIESFINEYNRPGAIFHFRIKTHGPISNNNCHPFVIFSKDAGAPFDLVMFHNGVLYFTDELRRGKTDDRTDSEIFASEYLRPILQNNPEMLYSEAFKNLLKQVVGSSKLVFLDSTGRRLIINEKKGEDSNGIWYSNKSAFEPEEVEYTAFNYPVYSNYNNRKTRLSNYIKSVERDNALIISADGVGVLRFEPGRDRDSRLKKRPSFWGQEQSKYSYLLNKSFIKTRKGLYFFDYDLQTWVQCDEDSMDKFEEKICFEEVVK